MSDAAAGFVELAPEPPSGRVFEQRLWPGLADANGDWRVRVDAIARWLQDIARLDLLDAGFAHLGIWVVRRNRIRVESFPRWDEELTLRTWCSGMGRFTAERRTSIRGQAGRVETATMWVWLDAESLLPRRFEPEFVEVYAGAASERNPSARLRHPPPPAELERTPFEFRATDVDLAGHVNNSHFLVPLEERLAGSDPAAIDLEVEHRDAVMPGPALVAAEPDGSAIWIEAPDRTLHASIRVAASG